MCFVGSVYSFCWGLYTGSKAFKYGLGFLVPGTQARLLNLEACKVAGFRKNRPSPPPLSPAGSTTRSSTETNPPPPPGPQIKTKMTPPKNKESNAQDPKQAQAHYSPPAQKNRPSSGSPPGQKRRRSPNVRPADRQPSSVDLTPRDRRL